MKLHLCLPELPSLAQQIEHWYLSSNFHESDSECLPFNQVSVNKMWEGPQGSLSPQWREQSHQVTWGLRYFLLHFFSSCLLIWIRGWCYSLIFMNFCIFFNQVLNSPSKSFRTFGFVLRVSWFRFPLKPIIPYRQNWDGSTAPKIIFKMS